MEKMLDKKSRDFAKNMQDTMVYDKDKNEVQIGANLFVDGKAEASAFLQPPTFQIMPSIINYSDLPLEGAYRIFDATNKSDVSIINVEGMQDELEIKTGNAFIILDSVFHSQGAIDTMDDTPGANNNRVVLIKQASDTRIAIINLHGAVLITKNNDI